MKGEHILKKLISAVLVFAALALFSWNGSASAGEIERGAQIFSANCAACHAGGGNVVNAAKTLRKDALEKYDMASTDAIVYQVTNGKNAMPAFRGRLSDDDLQDVAAYVLYQAESGW
jgi:cytochrome c6